MEFAKNAKVDGRLIDVVTPEMYGAHKELYQNINTGIELENQDDGKKYVLPIRNQTDDRPGIYDAGMVYFIKYPDENEKELYASENLNMVDYNNISSVQDFISTQEQLRDIESEILTDIDNVFMPTPIPTNSPEMAALREATCMKKCDINKYASRFGDNFLNDKRLFKGDNISMYKLVSIAKNLDMEVELLIRDKNPNVMNPMNQEVRAILTGGNGNDQ